MSDKIIALFGGTGFLGRYVIKHLAAEGYRIRVLSRSPGAANHLKPLGNSGQISFEYADLAKPETLEGKLDGVYGVVNMVGILYEGGKQRFSALHAQGAERIAQQAARAGVTRLVQISSLGVDKAERSSYARTKYAGERAVLAAFPNATILRPSILFGPEDNFFNQFATMTRLSPALPLIGGGKTRFQPVYVDDVARAVTRCLSDDMSNTQTYELGGPEILTFKDLLSYMLTHLDKKRMLLPMPFPIARLMGRFAQLLPKPPLTKDQVTLLAYDNIVDETALGFKELGIAPTPMGAIVPDYLNRYVFKG